MSLSQRVRQTAFRTTAEELSVALLVAAAHLLARLEEICAEAGITHDQYNVLRILRGVYPDGHPRYEIGRRLINRAPDVTRLLDRLEARGLVIRYRAEGDRRLSLARITDRGLAVLERLDAPIAAAETEFTAPLSTTGQRDLARLCSRLIPRDGA
jgi:DNA-binding MarR family transcriptional regulator